MDSAAGQKADKLELWGGYECTVNRVGDRWFDQTPRTGHEHRISDLQLFADLGMTSLRYPALWERMSPERPDAVDFCWTDERLPELKRLGLNPILTLCTTARDPGTRACCTRTSRRASPPTPAPWPSATRGSATGRR